MEGPEQPDELTPPANNARRRTSAAGERTAVPGYRAQWRVAARLIMEALRGDALEWIAVTDPAAGLLDDLQIGDRTRIDAYQIRSSFRGKPFSYAELTSPSKDQPSLLAQIAWSWSALQTAATVPVFAHLRTPRPASSADAVPGIAGEPHDFAAFLREVFEPAQLGAAPSERWRPAWDHFRASTGLAADQIDRFISACRLEFGIDVSTTARTREDQQWHQDEGRLVQLLADLPGPAGVVRLDRAELLERLGMTTRVSARNRHEFPVEQAYEPITACVEELTSKLDRLTSGYLAVIGSPGTGKSTLLTDALRRRDERFVAYYAYVPEAQDPINTRGESVNFLHDVVLSLEHHGFVSGQTFPSFDRLELLDRFTKQLQRLSADYRATGRKTVILIDGLDHIEREQQPDRSLLADLPVADALPEGIVIVLGSQTDAVLPVGVQATVQSGERRVEMAGLSRAAVFKLIEQSAAGSRTSNAQREAIWEKSAGHPLALRLLLRRIDGLPDGADVQSILDETEPIRESIEELYRTYWRSLLDREPAVAELLASLARLRRPIDLTWIASWTTPETLARFRFVAYQYFWAESGDQWHFFHNSFRVFVEHESALARPGLRDTALDQSRHSTLAEHSHAAPSDSLQRWEELYHLSRAGARRDVVAFATAATFRAQLEHFRPVDAIRADIELALRAALAECDTVAVVRLVLCRGEFASRESALGDHPLAEKLLDVGLVDRAKDHVRDGRRLRIKPEEALSVTEYFEAAGLPEEARRIFDAAEPLSFLYSGIPDRERPAATATLVAWAQVAPRYRAVTALRSAISQIRILDRQDARDEVEEAQLRLRLRQEAAVAYADLGRWSEFGELTTDIYSAGEEDGWFAIVGHVCRAEVLRGDADRASELLARLEAHATGRTLDEPRRIALAELLYLHRGDVTGARIVLDGVDPPTVRETLGGQRNGLRPYHPLIRYVRLRAALGDTPAARDLVADATERHQRGPVQFQRSLCAVAQLEGRTWAGARLTRYEVEGAVLGPLRILNRNFLEERDEGWYPAREARAELAEWIVRVVARSGDLALGALRDVFASEWSGPTTRQFWSTDVRRQVVLALLTAGLPRAWARQQLEDMAASEAGAGSIEDRVNAALDQADAWIGIGERLAAQACLRTAMRSSFGVGYHEDYQLGPMINWAASRLTQEDDRGAPLLTLMAQGVSTMGEPATEDAPQLSAAADLLAIATRWSPVRAVHLLRWLSVRGLITHAEGVATVLEGLASSSDPRVLVTLIVELLMPISNDAHPALARAVISRARTVIGAEVAVEIAKELIGASAVSAVSDARTGWRFAVADALSLGGIGLSLAGLETAESLPGAERERVGDRLTLEDGTVLSRAAVRARAQAGQDLRPLITGEAEPGKFKWDAVIDGLNPEQCVTVGRMFAQDATTGRKSTAAMFLNRGGQSAEAWTAAMAALNDSIPQGWDPQWDGGSRLIPLRILQSIDPERARPIIWEYLTADIGAAFRWTYAIATVLPEVATMLADDEATREGIVAEAQEYMRSLFAHAALPATDPTAVLGTVPLDRSAAAAAAELLISHFELPIFVVLECSIRAASLLLMRGNGPLEQVLIRMLGGTDDQLVEHALAAVHAAFINGAQATGLLPAVRQLADSNDSAIAFAAREILTSARESPPPSRLEPLPTRYRIELDRDAGPGLRIERPFRIGEPLADTDDRHERIAPYDQVHLPLLAKIAGVPEEALALRIVELMPEVAAPTAWSAEAERILRRRLNATDLEYTFIRPRPSVARRALLRAARELERARRLPTVGPPRGLLVEYDPTLATQRPTARPAEVPHLRRMRFADRKTWVNEPPVIEDRLAAWSDGRVVLAEASELRALDWGQPREMRRSAVCSANTDTLRQWRLRVPVEAVSNQRVSDYPQIDSDEHFLIIASEQPWYTPSDWLAMSPEVAISLDWRLDPTGLFRWRTSSGEIAVESMWWRDGTPGGGSLREVECGEGWVVLASRDAVGQLASRHGGLKRVATAWRQIYDEDRSELEGLPMRVVEPIGS